MAGQWTLAPPRESGGRRQGGIALIVVGSILAIVAFGVLAGGGILMWADRTQRDAAGYLQSPSTNLSTGAYAVAATDLNIVVSTPGWRLPEGALGSVRITTSTPTAGRLFIGIAPRSAVLSYLNGVDYATLTGFNGPDSAPSLQQHGGGAPGNPTDQSFWRAQVSGAGTQSLTWKVQAGQWAIVLMNADASRGVNADVSAGATAPFLFALALGLLIGGAVVALLAIALLIAATSMLSRRQRYRGLAPAPPPPPVIGGSLAPTSAGAATSVHPLRIEGRLEPTSRWLWLVKWLLLIPHYIVLAFLFIAAFLLTVVAFFAILVTGRYPRSIFDFNVGVLRWAWRVGYYGYSALGTDRYPPFSLYAAADYPASLDVQYPERLSRGLVLIKWWLLAIPHYIILAVLVGGTTISAHNGHPSSLLQVPSSGLISLLVIVGGVVLLFTSRYPRGIFDLAMGLNRWVYRVFVYVMLMRDEYPPFRLDMGGDEPHAAPGSPLPAPPPPPPPAGPFVRPQTPSMRGV